MDVNEVQFFPGVSELKSFRYGVKLCFSDGGDSPRVLFIGRFVFLVAFYRSLCARRSPVDFFLTLCSEGFYVRV